MKWKKVCERIIVDNKFEWIKQLYIIAKIINKWLINYSFLNYYINYNCCVGITREAWGYFRPLWWQRWSVRKKRTIRTTSKRRGWRRGTIVFCKRSLSESNSHRPYSYGGGLCEEGQIQVQTRTKRIDKKKNKGEYISKNF